MSNSNYLNTFQATVDVIKLVGGTVIKHAKMVEKRTDQDQKHIKQHQQSFKEGYVNQHSQDYQG